MKYLTTASLVWVLSAFSAQANDTSPLIGRWYSALEKADAEQIEELLSPNAVIKLNDLGTSQTKAEFIDSMSEWKSAIEDGSIRYKQDGGTAEALAYRVCYTFKSNELLTREVFIITDDKIQSSEQTTLSESCKDF